MGLPEIALLAGCLLAGLVLVVYWTRSSDSGCGLWIGLWFALLALAPVAFMTKFFGWYE